MKINTVLKKFSVSLNSRLAALATMRYAGPAHKLPVNGNEWPENFDFPEIKVTISLPVGSDNYYLDTELQMNVSVFDNYLTSSWGCPATKCREASCYFSGPSLSAVIKEQEAKIRENLQQIVNFLKERDARIAQREATLSKGLDVVVIENEAAA